MLPMGLVIVLKIGYHLCLYLFQHKPAKGKNYFIEETLLQYVKELNYTPGCSSRILILSNRIALRLQTKNHLKEKFGKNFVTVLSYQGLLGHINSNQFYNTYSHVICDECHFFTSDAMFNPCTDLILSKIIETFRNAVRIYMSATINDCLQYICKKELDMSGRKLDKSNKILCTYFTQDQIRYFITTGNCGDFMYYKFNHNYSYPNIKYFSDHSELKEIIAKSNEKWLIFIDDKQKCLNFKQDLLSFNPNFKKDDILVISSENKEDSEYQQLIINEKFEQKVLISTSVIDNGINFHDKKLKNIVISDVNKDKCLQMIGRVRVQEESKINLYIKRIDEKHIEKLIADLERQREAYYLHNIAYPSINNYLTNKRLKFNNKYYNGKASDFEDAKHWFFRDFRFPEFVYPNNIARLLVNDVLKPRYESILEEMKEAKKKEEGEENSNINKYLEYQLSWFDNTYDEINDITFQTRSKALAGFNEYIKTLQGIAISKNEQPSFKLEFFKKYNLAHGLRAKEDGFKGNENKSRVSKEGYGMSIINQIFSVKGINLEIKSDKDGNWKFEKKNESE